MKVFLRKQSQVMAVLVFVASLVGFAAPMWAETLESTRTSTAPTLDGTVDSVWSNAKAITVELDKTPYEPNNGYAGMTEVDVTLKSLYDGNNVYFLVQYKDPTYSVDRFPWIKQSDGSWKQLKATDDTGHDNTYYEDKFAMYWNINADKFESRGCAAVCHKARNGKIDGIEDKSPARKFTVKEGQTVDMWHWKGVRSNPVGQMDDQFVDHKKGSGGWGRHGDTGGGGYKNNESDDKMKPAFMGASMMWNGALKDSEKKPFHDDYKAGDRVPGIVVSPFTGSRGDIKTVGVWKDGVWTLEVQRALRTTGENAESQDVQFTSMSKEYAFGVSVFDNSQINHIYHEKPHKLVFK